MGSRVLCVVFLLTLFAAPAWAEDAELAAKIRVALEQPGRDGTDALELLLKQTPDATDRTVVREALANALAERGEPFASLEHWEHLMAAGKTAARRLGYAEALVAVAKNNLAGRPTTAASVVTYLIDARRVLGDIVDEPFAQREMLGRVVLVHAESWFYEGKLEEARKVLEAASIGDFRDTEGRAAYDLLAQVRYRGGDYAGAAEAFEKAGNTRGNAAAWAAAKDAERTVAAYASLLEAAPTDLVLLGDAVSAARFASGEKAMAEKLESLEPEDTVPAVSAAYRIARFDLMESVGEADAAEPLLEEAAELDVTDIEACIRLGRRALARSDRERSTEMFLRAFERDAEDPRVVNALWHLAGLDYQDFWRSAAAGPELDRSLRIQRALVEKAPDDAMAWANLGNTLRVGGHTQEAIAAYGRAREENPYDPAILSDLGLALSAAFRPDEALAAYVASVELDDSHLAGRQNAGRALWRLGRDDEAETQLAEALRKARSAARVPMTYRFLLDRVFRTREDGDLR